MPAVQAYKVGSESDLTVITKFRCQLKTGRVGATGPGMSCGTDGRELAQTDAPQTEYFLESFCQLQGLQALHRQKQVINYCFPWSTAPWIPDMSFKYAQSLSAAFSIFTGIGYGYSTFCF